MVHLWGCRSASLVGFSCASSVVLVLTVGFLGSLLNDVLDVAWTVVVFFEAVLKWVGLIH